MKDWTGNKTSTFSILGASSHSELVRVEDDYYATDPTAINDLFKLEDFSQTIWECACGGGHLSKVMAEEFGKDVLSTDLIYRGYGQGGVDFLKEDITWNGDIITNPPYKQAEEFVTHSMKLIERSEVAGLKVAMFLKLTFLEGKGRQKLFAKYPPARVYVYSFRKTVARNGDPKMFKMSSAACYAWFVWEKGFVGDPIIKWIN